MSIYELRTRLSKGELNSEEFTKIIMAMQANEALLSKNYQSQIRRS